MSFTFPYTNTLCTVTQIKSVQRKTQTKIFSGFWIMWSMRAIMMASIIKYKKGPAIPGWLKNEFSLLTQFGDANLLQVLPGDVFDNRDGVVAIVTQSLLVLRQSDHT